MKLIRRFLQYESAYQFEGQTAQAHPGFSPCEHDHRNTDSGSYSGSLEAPLESCSLLETKAHPDNYYHSMSRILLSCLGE
ncbi:hypothetical protein R1flu_021550 [Riccia fluitans]|uniref:Uncharacterized protein n=1 Tax=Riccia fluitans TaxID=41844 RepID=A0ABD1ZQV7_9MARC